MDRMHGCEWVTVTTIDANTELIERLRRLARRQLAVGFATAFAWSVGAVIACLLVGVWLDVVFDFSARLRIGTMLVASAAGFMTCVVLIAATWRSCRTSRLARRIDEAGATRGRIRAAVDLVDRGRFVSAVSRGMAALAVEQAVELARRVRASAVVPMRPLTTAWATLALTVLVLGGIVAAAWPIARVQWLRFTDPFGDHPPYSRVAFAVEPGNARVIFGASQEIRVETIGAPVDRLELVLLPAGTGEARDIAEQIIPMFGEGSGTWRATLASVTEPTRYFVRTGEGRSHRYRLDLITLPRIESVRVRVTPPAYANRGAYEGGVPPDGIAGLARTHVRFTVVSNRPLSAGRISLGGESDFATATSRPAPIDVEMQPVEPDGREVAGTIELRRPGRVELRVCDVQGQWSQEAFTTAVRLQPDQRPFIRLLEPRSMTLASYDTPLPVNIAAEDDCGISRVSLYRSLNDSRPLPVHAELPSPLPMRHVESCDLPLAAYGLRAGDEIKLFARVEDNDPAGAKGAETPLATVRIVSPAEYEQLMLARHGLEILQARHRRARERMAGMVRELERLRNELATRPAGAPLDDEAKRALDDLADRMRHNADEIARSADEPLPYALDEKMSEHMRQLAARLAEAAERTDELHEQSPGAGGAPAELEKIAAACRGGQQDYEQKTTRPLEQFAAIYRLMADANRYTALYQRQKSLADRLESMKQDDAGDDPRLRSRFRDLEAEQFRVREDLRALLREVTEHVEALPEDMPKVDQLRETAIAFVNGVNDSGATEAMSDAEAGLATLDGLRGASSARRAEQIMLQFISQCSGMGEQGGQCLKFNPSLGQAAASAAEDLLAGAGMSTGPNGPLGAGGGYSARMTTLENVGLHGGLPSLGGGGEREGDGASGPGLGRPAVGNFGRGEPGRVSAIDELRAGGAGRELVPLEYRERVGAYFERIADELGEGPRSDSK